MLFLCSLLVKNIGSSIHLTYLRTLSLCNKLSSKSFTAEDRSTDPNTYKRGRNDEDRENHKWTKSPYKIKQLRFSRHIVNLVHKGKVSEAAEVFESMRGNKVKADAVVYNSLIAGYGRSGNVEASFRVFNQMKKHGLVPTDHTYTSMLSACAEAGTKANEILTKVESEIERRGVRLNTIATNAHINALASCRQQEHALKAYLDMIKTGTTPDLHTYSSLLQASAKDRVEGMVIAQRVWEEMIATGHQPDLYNFNLLLQCLRDAGLEGTRSNDCEELIRVPAVKIPSDLQRSSTVIADSSSQDEVRLSSPSINVKQTGSFEVFLSKTESLTVNLGSVATKGVSSSSIRWLDRFGIEILFESLKTLNLKPDIRMFHLLLQLMLSPNDVLSRSQECGVKPDARALVAAIRVQAKLGNMTGAKAILSYSHSMGVDMGQFGYQAVANSCVRQEEGLELLAEIKAVDLVPNEHVFETLIGNAARSRNFVYLTALIKKMRHFEVLPSNSLIETLDAAANQKPKSVYLLRQLNGFKGYYSIWKEMMVGSKVMMKRTD